MCRSFAAFLLAVLLDLFAEDFLGSRLVAILVEFEAAAALRLVDGPAGEHARHLRDVGLRIAAVHAEGVQFHQLAGVVFVQAFGGNLLASGRRAAAILAFSAAGESGPMLLELSR
jgi:hypothetical protein